MKTIDYIKNHCQRSVSALITCVLGILGYSCSNDDPGEVVCEYGCPHANFEIKGTVTDQDNQPIEAKVIAELARYENPSIPFDADIFVLADTVDTNAKGEYLWIRSDMPRDEITISCMPVDTAKYDGESMRIQLVYEGGDHHWYVGKATQEVNFVLKEKNTEQ